ncbi:hypothetical protein ABTX60_07065 [Streptomyces sp. NPDC126510]|uniref:hypothetical protein n=1 Tax=Streptomyces sp. NPDC126510 TaxID=3155317 RepID=UPI00332F0342
MNDNPPDVHLAIYGPDRFPKPSPFGEHGYLFTVPGSWPEDTPSHTNVPDWPMAVYRTPENGDEWEVRDVNGNRRVWGTGGARREAIGLAFLEIARMRRIQAAEIGRKRAADGLEPAPPYQVEATSSTTLVLDPARPDRIGILVHIEGVGTTPTVYRVHSTDGATEWDIPARPGITLRTTQLGVLHIRCGCTPEDTARFDDMGQAMYYGANAMTMWWPCPKNPEELFTVDGSDYGPYPALPATDSWGPYEPISVTRATAEQIAHDLNTLNAGCGLTAQWNGADLVFAWDQRYRDDNGTQTVTPDGDDRYQIGGLWPWMRWTDQH